MPAHFWMLFYGALAISALAALWHNRETRPLGLALVVAWVLSNIIHLGLAFEWRPILYPLIDLMIAVTARQLWRRTGYRIAVVTTVLSLLNCLVNVSYAISALKTIPILPESLHYTHTLATNIIFGSKCLSLIFWGAADAYGWFDRIGYLLGRGGRGSESYSRQEARKK